MHVWERSSAYIVKAGTIIFAAAVGVWALSNFGWATWDAKNRFGLPEELPLELGKMPIRK